MKRILILIFGLTFGFISCQKESLELINPNAPGVDAIKSESGMAKAAYGVYSPLRYAESTSAGFYYIWFNQWVHNIMGDATISSVGNFGIRWANQTAQIIRPNGAIVTPPVGGKQPKELDDRNSRDWGSDNVQAFEWFPAYALIGHCNLMLSVLDDVQFSGSADAVKAKKDTYKAWFLWWKGFAYSRLGSIYKQGLVVNTYGEQNNTFVARQGLIDEAAKNFNAAKEVLATINDANVTYAEVFNSVIPAHFKTGKGGLITPSMWIRNINTYLARNILVNKYASELTAADLTAIETLANAGITATDKIFTARSAATNCLVYTTAWSGYRLNLAWERVSERLIQEFKEGDKRFAKNFLRSPAPQVNPAARGFQYSTRWDARSVDTGGEFMSYTAGAVEIPLAGTYEENQLMLAEVKIRRGDIDGGLAHVDMVRTYQKAELPATVGQNLASAAALEELRIERRIGLFLKGVSFYDARRWGVLKPLAQGGGRTNAWVVFDPTAQVAESCTIEYDYKEWWDVPANETDFNPTASSNALSSEAMNLY
jgi:starch-binding outer membrane protein, SusD/RagB family